MSFGRSTSFTLTDCHTVSGKTVWTVFTGHALMHKDHPIVTLLGMKGGFQQITMLLCLRASGNVWAGVVSYLGQSGRSCGLRLLRGIPASYTLRLRPSYPTRRRTPSPSDARGRSPLCLHEDLTHSPAAPRSPPLQHTDKNMQ